MRPVTLAAPGERLAVLCLGCHSDDIEIGSGGTLLSLIARGVQLDVHWSVLSGAGGQRENEARSSADNFLAGAPQKQIEVLPFRDGFFPQQAEVLKTWLEGLKQRINPDLIFVHRRDDAHQDHRLISSLSWNTFRDHCILEYEISKWDGDMGQPNVYVPISKSIVEQKIDLLMAHFGSQRSKQWFDPETFRGLARLRGMECRAPEGYAEAFWGRKLSFG